MEEARFIQREISWNAFNARVLNEGFRDDMGLLDRLKFAAIASSNYDEFFMVRVARLMRQVQEGDLPISPGGNAPSLVLTQLLNQVRQVAEKQDHLMTQSILPGLAAEGLVILPPEQWGVEEGLKAEEVFENELLSACTPVLVTPGRGFADLAAHARTHAVFLLDDGCHVLVRIPNNIRRFRYPRTDGEQRKIILLEDILLNSGRRFFPNRELRAVCLFRVLRDADMNVDEERDEDFIEAMEEVLERRERSFPVRLDSRGDADLSDAIRRALQLPQAHHFHWSGPMNISGFLSLTSLPGFTHLRSPEPTPQVPEDLYGSEDLWETIRNGDLLLHHPYESFAPIISMVEAASGDTATVAIKMTLYRTSGDSPIVQALIRAAELGIQVTVLVELKARFDEGANIGWADRLEKAGAIVIYGLAVLKVHAKILMVLRREDTGIQRYAHLGTGNYNDATARVYTDMGLITARDDYTRDAALVFNAITGYSAEPHLKTLIMAPFSLRRETLRLIRREEERARGGEEARIIAKMNSLLDPQIITALYSASSAGVRIDLNVRGVCCLRPGVPGLSENIRVISIIDRFLEHTRVFAYHNGGRREVYISSADWMTRNLDRRVELLIPIAENRHIRRINSILERYFQDNSQSWELGSDGEWKPGVPKKGEKAFRIQEFLTHQSLMSAKERVKEEKRALKVRRRS